MKAALLVLLLLSLPTLLRAQELPPFLYGAGADKLERVGSQKVIATQPDGSRTAWRKIGDDWTDGSGIRWRKTAAGWQRDGSADRYTRTGTGDWRRTAIDGRAPTIWTDAAGGVHAGTNVWRKTALGSKREH